MVRSMLSTFYTPRIIWYITIAIIISNIVSSPRNSFATIAIPAMWAREQTDGGAEANNGQFLGWSPKIHSWLKDSRSSSCLYNLWTSIIIIYYHINLRVYTWVSWKSCHYGISEAICATSSNHQIPAADPHLMHLWTNHLRPEWCGPSWHPSEPNTSLVHEYPCDQSWF